MPSGSKEKNREYQAKWYKDNRAKQAQKVADRRKELYEWYWGYKNSLKCVICGESHKACLDFHHINPSEKEGNIGFLIKCGRSKENILKEMDKCVVLCANCHRKEHFDVKSA